MSIKEFDKTFGLKSSIEEEKIRFVNRIENSIFSMLLDWYQNDQYKIIFKSICNDLGEDYSKISRKSNFEDGPLPSLVVLTQKDFIQTLRVIVAVYDSMSDKPNSQTIIKLNVLAALEKANLSLGIKWVDGTFYPTGDELLDKELIDESFTLLDKFPNEKLDFKNALENHYSKKLYGVVDNCYKVVEGVSRKLLNNTKTLDNNKDDFMRLLQFSKYWDKIFVNYLMYAHEYSRHASENRHNLKEEEVEGYLYLTCLILRVTIKASIELQKEKKSE